MTPLETRKAQLREYIEARAKSSQGHMTLYRRDHDNGYISYDVEDESMTAFMTTLLDCDQPKAKQNAEFTVLAANESALIAEQLLECIEALEKYADGRAYDFDRQNRGIVNFNMSLSMTTAKEALSKIGGEK